MERSGRMPGRGRRVGLGALAFVVFLCLVVLSGSARAERARLTLYKLEYGTECTIETDPGGPSALRLIPDGSASVHGYITVGDERKGRVSAGFDDLSEGFPGTLWARLEWPAARASGHGWALAGYLDASAGGFADSADRYLRLRAQTKAQRQEEGLLPAKLSASAFADGKWFDGSPERTYFLGRLQGAVDVGLPGQLELSASASAYRKEFPYAPAWTGETLAATVGVSGLSVGPVGVKVNGQATSKRYPYASDKDYVQTAVSLDLESGVRGGVKATLGTSFKNKDYPSDPMASSRVGAFEASLSAPGALIGGRCEGVGLRAYYSVSEYSDLSVRTYLSAKAQAEFDLTFADGDKGSLTLGIGFSTRTGWPGADGAVPTESGYPGEQAPDSGLADDEEGEEPEGQDVSSRVGLTFDLVRKLDKDTQFGLSGEFGWQRQGPEEPSLPSFAVSASFTWRLAL